MSPEMRSWLEYLSSQLWTFVLLGSLITLVFFIKVKSDADALDLMKNQTWGIGAAVVAWLAYTMAGPEPYWGLIIGAGATFAVLTFLPYGIQRSLVKSENWGTLVGIMAVIAGFVLLIMPSITPARTGQFLLGAVAIVALFVFTRRDQIRKLNKEKRPDIVVAHTEQEREAAAHNVHGRTQS